MAKELSIEEENNLKERKESIETTLRLIGFPEKLIDDEVYETMIKIKFEGVIIKDNKNVIFKNFTKNNTAERKFDYNLSKENIDFNIKPLFEKYHLQLKKEIPSKTLEENYICALKIYLILLKIYYLIVNNSIFSQDFDSFFINSNMKYIRERLGEKGVNNFIYFKGIYTQFEAYNDFIVLQENFVSKEEFEKIIFKYLNELKTLRNKISESAFISSPEIVSFDSIDLLYFKTLNSIYYLFLKNDIDTSKIDEMVNSFLEKKEDFDINFSSKEELVYKSFYFYQSFKIYSNNSLLESSIKDEVLNFYSQKFKKTFNQFYRVKNTKLLTKKEFIELLNEKDKSNFRRNINKFEKFINNFFHITNQKLSIKKDLDLYLLYYQELFHNKEEGSDKAMIRFRNKNNICQSDFELITRKLNRISFIDKMSVEKYKKFIEFQIKLRKIYTNVLYNEKSNVLFELIEKSIKLHIELNFNNRLKKVVTFNHQDINSNVYSTKHNK